jgi:hypothetical protein
MSMGVPMPEGNNMSEAEQIAVWLENLLAEQLKENPSDYKKAVKDTIQGIRGGWWKTDQGAICICTTIMAKDSKRHFKECPLRV